MIGQYLMYGAGYALAASITVSSLIVAWIGLKEREGELFGFAVPAFCLGVFLTGLLAYNQFPPSSIAEACR